MSISALQNTSANPQTAIQFGRKPTRKETRLIQETYPDIHFTPETTIVFDKRKKGLAKLFELILNFFDLFRITKQLFHSNRDPKTTHLFSFEIHNTPEQAKAGLKVVQASDNGASFLMFDEPPAVLSYISVEKIIEASQKENQPFIDSLKTGRKARNNTPEGDSDPVPLLDE